MSRTYSLVCHETKERIWVGQSGGTDGMGIFYSGEPKVMAALGRFLEATRGKSLVLLCFDDYVDHMCEYKDYSDDE